jgi:hypothetical protein
LPSLRTRSAHARHRFAVPDDKLDRFTASHRPGKEGLEVGDAPETSAFRKKPKFLSGGGGDASGGGLVSTARDYLRFAVLRKQVGGPLAFQEPHISLRCHLVDPDVLFIQINRVFIPQTEVFCDFMAQLVVPVGQLPKAAAVFL